MSYNNEFYNLSKLHSYNNVNPNYNRNDEEIISKTATTGFYKEKEEPRINSSHGERKNDIEFSSRRTRMSSTNIVDSNSFNFSKNINSSTGLSNVELARKEVSHFFISVKKL